MKIFVDIFGVTTFWTILRSFFLRFAMFKIEIFLAYAKISNILWGTPGMTDCLW